MAPGTLVGTVKIIAYAAGGAALSRACAAASPVAVRPVTRRTATLILTRAGEPDKLATKGREADRPPPCAPRHDPDFGRPRPP